VPGQREKFVQLVLRGMQVREGQSPKSAPQGVPSSGAAVSGVELTSCGVANRVISINNSMLTFPTHGFSVMWKSKSNGGAGSRRFVIFTAEMGLPRYKYHSNDIHSLQQTG